LVTSFLGKTTGGSNVGSTFPQGGNLKVATREEGSDTRARGLSKCVWVEEGRETVFSRAISFKKEGGPKGAPCRQRGRGGRRWGSKKSKASRGDNKREGGDYTKGGKKIRRGWGGPMCWTGEMEPEAKFWESKRMRAGQRPVGHAHKKEGNEEDGWETPSCGEGVQQVHKRGRGERGRGEGWGTGF